uniref:Uncharacterized protein n=1 Tax=Prevotella sp. GTC17259 TaxID=3236795 RepID=A0AB33J8B8_9BACT
MLQRDYYLRLIQEFMAALAKVLEKKEFTARKEELRKLYEQYVGPYALYATATIDEVMRALEGETQERRIMKLEMLSELYYHEGSMETGPTREIMLSKAFALLDYLEANSGTYSIERRARMAQLQKVCKQTGH